MVNIESTKGPSDSDEDSVPESDIDDDSNCDCEGCDVCDSDDVPIIE